MRLLRVSAGLCLALALVFFLLLFVRIEMGSCSPETVLHQIAVRLFASSDSQDREVGNRQWRDMLQQLPPYLVRTDVGVYSVLPEFLDVATEVTETEATEEEEELGVICMAEWAVRQRGVGHA